MRVKMCGIHVLDPAKAYAFYTGTLGFEDLLVIPEANLYVLRSPEDRHGVGLLLEPSDNPIARAYRDGLYAAGLPAVVLGVGELCDEYDRLVAAGVRFTGEPVSDDSGTHVIFDDTCGNFIQLHED
jgi:catechol 2,3-dioxygenase-like lactoylglutathione lyase family enzyme